MLNLLVFIMGLGLVLLASTLGDSGTCLGAIGAILILTSFFYPYGRIVRRKDE
jgi:uncharacterized BrkB/YihY/UPF0761 family membrane protein